MVSTFTPNKRIEQPAFNDYVNSWNIPVNADWAILDLAMGGVKSLNLTGLSGNLPLVATDYQPLKIVATGAPTAATNLVVPSGVGGLWVVRNNTTGGFAITIASAAGGSMVTIPAGTNTLVTCDGSATGMFAAINTPSAVGGSNTQVQFNSSGVLAGSSGLTWDGTTVTTTGLTNSGNTVLGDAIGDTLTLTGATATTPNGLNLNTNQFVLLGTPYNQVAIGTATVGSETLTVGGTIKSTAGGYVFPDSTIQTTAAPAAVWRRINRVVPTAAQTEVTFRNLPSDINDLMLYFDVIPTATAHDAFIQFYNPVDVLISAAGRYQWAISVANAGQAGDAASAWGSAGVSFTTGICLNGSIAGFRVSTQGISGTVHITNIRDTARRKKLTWQSAFIDQDNAFFYSGSGSGLCETVGLISGIRLAWDATTFAAGGAVTLWGAS